MESNREIRPCAMVSLIMALFFVAFSFALFRLAVSDAGSRQSVSLDSPYARASFLQHIGS